MITKEVIERLSADTKELFDFYDKKRLFKTKKQKSEDISGLLETAMADIIEGAVAPKIDAEPDIRLHGEPVEIKTTSMEYLSCPSSDASSIHRWWSLSQRVLHVI